MRLSNKRKCYLYYAVFYKFLLFFANYVEYDKQVRIFIAENTIMPRKANEIFLLTM